MTEFLGTHGWDQDLSASVMEAALCDRRSTVQPSYTVEHELQVDCGADGRCWGNRKCAVRAGLHSRRLRAAKPLPRTNRLLVESADIEIVAKNAVGRGDRCACGNPVVDQRLLLDAKAATVVVERHASQRARGVAIDFLEQQTLLGVVWHHVNQTRVFVAGYFNEIAPGKTRSEIQISCTAVRDGEVAVHATTAHAIEIIEYPLDRGAILDGILHRDVLNAGAAAGDDNASCGPGSDRTYRGAGDRHENDWPARDAMAAEYIPAGHPFR